MIIVLTSLIILSVIYRLSIKYINYKERSKVMKSCAENMKRHIKIDFIEWIYFILLSILFFYFNWISLIEDFIKVNITVESNILLSYLFLLSIFLIDSIVDIIYHWYPSVKIYWYSHLSFIKEQINYSFLIDVFLWSINVFFILLMYYVFWVQSLLISWVIVIFISIIWSYLYSTRFLHLYYNPKEIKNGWLKDKITKLAKDLRFPIENIFIIRDKYDDWTSHCIWIWRHTKILLSQNSIRKLNKNEILSILAHEIGHYKNNDSLKNIVIFFVFTQITLLITYFILKFSIFNINSIHIWLLIAIILAIPIHWVINIFENYISRKNEIAADLFSCKNTNIKSVISGLHKSAFISPKDPYPHPLYEFLTYSHPSLLRRIRLIWTLTWHNKNDKFKDIISSCE